MYRMFTLIWAMGVALSASHAQAVTPMGGKTGSERAATDGQKIRIAHLTEQQMDSNHTRRATRSAAHKQRASRTHARARSQAARHARAASRRVARGRNTKAVYAYRSRRVTVSGAATEDSKQSRRLAAGKGRRARSVAAGTTMTGMASYYWHPQRVASGGWFNPRAMTAAHKTLPFGTRVRVTNSRNGRSVDVTINDRGPYVPGRIIDLSAAAAGAIGMKSAGVAPVKVEVLGD